MHFAPAIRRCHLDLISIRSFIGRGMAGARPGCHDESEVSSSSALAIRREAS